MSIHNAMRFISLARDDATLRAALESLQKTAPDSFAALRTLGEERGLDFTGEELQNAFGHDWTMRWLRRRQRDET